MGQPGLYNKNRIRDKTLTGSYFFEINEVAEWQGYGIGLEKQYYMLRNVVNVASYDLAEMDWAEYLTHFTYLVEGLKDYRDELSKKHSDIDQKI